LHWLALRDRCHDLETNANLYRAGMPNDRVLARLRSTRFRSKHRAKSAEIGRRCCFCRTNQDMRRAKDRPFPTVAKLQCRSRLPPSRFKAPPWPAPRPGIPCSGAYRQTG
jgi:hypothetical protein